MTEYAYVPGSGDEFIFYTTPGYNTTDYVIDYASAASALSSPTLVSASTLGVFSRSSYVLMDDNLVSSVYFSLSTFNYNGYDGTNSFTIPVSTADELTTVTSNYVSNQDTFKLIINLTANFALPQGSVVNWTWPNGGPNRTWSMDKAIRSPATSTTSSAGEAIRSFSRT